MPWKNETDPYKIWVSEIILQQTRVEYGSGYYEKFIHTFPTVEALAQADDNFVFKLWEGLGYYSRCRNLLHTARYIQSECGGVFPDTYEEIRKLKGIGPYTAAAIASFAFNLSHAVVDGNVYRVLARYFAIDIPIDSTAGKQYFSDKANFLLNGHSPSAFNQAIMDLGALICKPGQPLCTECPLRNGCLAFATNTIGSFPVKRTATPKRKRYFYYFVVRYQDLVYVRQRTERDIWQGLYEFILMETSTPASLKKLHQHTDPHAFQWQDFMQVKRISPLQRQVLSHQIITGKFYEVEIDRPLPTGGGYDAVPVKSIHQLAFPKYITSYLKDENGSLHLF